MPKPLVVFTNEAYDWLRGYTMAVQSEIGGFGYVYSPEKGIFVVDTIYLAPQTASPGGVHFKDGAMAFMVEKAVEDERLNDARFSWHSHNTMGVFWSSTDEEGIEDYKRTGMPWLVSAVTNHKGEIKVRVDIFDTICDHVSIQDCEVQIGFANPEMRERIESDIKELVELRPTQAKNSGTGNSNNSGGTGSSHKGKHRPAGTKQLPAGSHTGSDLATSAEWWDEIDWANVTDEELTQIMKDHGFDVEDETDLSDDEKRKAQHMAALESAH